MSLHLLSAEELRTRGGKERKGNMKGHNVQTGNKVEEGNTQQEKEEHEWAEESLCRE